MAQDLPAHLDLAEHLAVPDKPERQDPAKAVHQDLEPQDQPELASEHQDLLVVASALPLVEHLAVQDLLAAVAAELELPELSVRVDLAESLASRSEPREKNSNKEKPQALAAPWCRAAMATLFCACVVDHRSRTLPTRLALTRVS